MALLTDKEYSPLPVPSAAGWEKSMLSTAVPAYKTHLPSVDIISLAALVSLSLSIRAVPVRSSP